MVNATILLPARRQRPVEVYSWTASASDASSEDLRRSVVEQESSRTSRAWNASSHDLLSIDRQERYGPSVAQIINQETQSRLVSSRLRELINELRHLRTSAQTLSARSRENEIPLNLHASLRALDNSVIHLHVAIQDLENRSTGASRSSRDVLSPRQIVNSFTPSPLQSLLTRARHEDSASSLTEQDHDQSEATASTAGILERSLDQFSQNLAHLNMRLDRVAENFGQMHARNAPFGRTSGRALLTNIDDPDSTSRQDRLSQFSYLNSSAADSLHHSISGRLARGQEVSPEEFELQLRLRQFHSGSSRPEWDSDAHRRGLLEISRRALLRSAQHIPYTTSDSGAYRTNQIIDTQAPQAEQSWASPSWTRSSQTTSESIPARRRLEVCKTMAPAAETAKISRFQNEAEAFAIKPRISFRSSHACLFREPQKLFWHGIEYRNCLGLWLSRHGQAAPEAALESIRHADTLDREQIA